MGISSNVLVCVYISTFADSVLVLAIKKLEDIINFQKESQPPKHHYLQHRNLRRQDIDNARFSFLSPPLITAHGSALGGGVVQLFHLCDTLHKHRWRKQDAGAAVREGPTRTRGKSLLLRLCWRVRRSHCFGGNGRTLCPGSVEHTPISPSNSRECIAGKEN